jgi:hypothetical protein
MQYITPAIQYNKNSMQYSTVQFDAVRYNAVYKETQYSEILKQLEQLEGSQLFQSFLIA